TPAADVELLRRIRGRILAVVRGKQRAPVDRADHHLADDERNAVLLARARAAPRQDIRRIPPRRFLAGSGGQPARLVLVQFARRPSGEQAGGGYRPAFPTAAP